MYIYEKKLEYPVKIKQTNPALAKLILTQYGGLYGNSVYQYHFHKTAF
jgi:spore coat protein JC